MKNNKVLYLLIAVLLSLPLFARAELQLNRFDAHSYKTIIAQHQGNSFLMVLWSLDCPPCIEELGSLGKFHQLHDKVNIIMVSTDNENQKDDIQQLMSKHGLDDIQQWVFSTDSEQAIRFSIDPQWYGELPRNYFHDKQHKRQVKSGRLNEAMLSAWLELINNKTTDL